MLSTRGRCLCWASSFPVVGIFLSLIACPLPRRSRYLVLSLDARDLVPRTLPLPPCLCISCVVFSVSVLAPVNLFRVVWHGYFSTPLHRVFQDQRILQTIKRDMNRRTRECHTGEQAQNMGENTRPRLVVVCIKAIFSSGPAGRCNWCVER